MLGKVGLRCGGYAAGAQMLAHGDGREQEREKAKDRDGKENVHATVRRITSAWGSCILFESVLSIRLDNCRRMTRRGDAVPREGV